MAHPRTIPALVATPEERTELETVARSRTAPARRIARARMLCAYLDGRSIPAIAAAFPAPVITVRRCVQKALAYGVRRALDDLPRAGRARRITAEARAWISSSASHRARFPGIFRGGRSAGRLKPHVKGDAQRV